MLLMNIIILGISYPILFIMYFFMKLEISDKKETLLGISIPKEFRQDSAITEVLTHYKKSMRWILIAMIIFPLCFIWLNKFTFYITGYLLWIYLMMFAFIVPFARYGEQLKKIKYENGWGCKKAQTTTVDFSLALQPVHAVKKWIFLLLSAVSIIPVIFELQQNQNPEMKWTNVLILAILAGDVWLFSILSIWMDKQKSEILSQNSTMNQNFNRSKKRIRARYFTWIAGLSTVLVYLTSFHLHDRLGGMTGFFFTITVYTILLCWLVVYSELKILRLRKKMTKDLYDYDQDENNWYFGALMYYNPNDKHFMVEKRIGFGYSINMASVGGKISAAFIIILLAGCLFGIPWLVGMDEFTPVSLEIEEETIQAVHNKTRYEIPEKEIQNVKLLEELPEVSRKNGTGLPNLSKGYYKIGESSSGYLCLNPENELFLMIETKDDTIYLFSDNTDKGTATVYQNLMEELKKE